MFLDKDSIVINNVSMGEYLIDAKYGYHKLWGNDSGRNLAGVMSGTLVGIFPKITLTFRPLTQAEIEIVAPILDSENQSTSYYDPNIKNQVTMTTYTGDYEIKCRNIMSDNVKCDSFNCAFISKRKRT